MASLWIALQVLALLFIGALVANALINARLLRPLGGYALPQKWPRVSVLVPARNEEADIAACVRSLLAQDYEDLEVVVLDDRSEDRTLTILSGLAAEDRRLRVLQGKSLPEGWMGKNWACHQLSQAARGELFLFTDADTQHHPHMLRDGVAALQALDADLLSAFPRQEVGSWSERLLVPVLTWSFMLFLPLGLAYRWRTPALSIAIGQFLLFRRRAYEAIGGHAAVRSEVVDDMALARRVKAHGLCWRLADGSQRVQCRMYRGFRDAFLGVSKSLFPGVQYNVSAFAVAMLWAGFVALQPLAVLLAWLAGVSVPGLSLALAAVTVVFSLLLVGAVYPRFSFPIYLGLLYPVTVVTMLAVSACSLCLAFLGRFTWKGRRLARQRLHWW